MSSLDIVLISVLVTAILLVAVFFIVKGVRAVWKLFLSLGRSITAAEATLQQVRPLLQQIRDEMVYLRSITQAASPNFGQPENPNPPIGRAGRMPTPEFPVPVWDRFATPPPDATEADTDMEVLEQTDKELLEAQAHEELRAHGIEPDPEDDRPQQAVVEEV